MIKEEELMKIGFFAKPHGVKGEIAIVTDCDISGISGDPCVVCNINGIWTPFFVASYRQKNASTALIAFENLDSADKVKFLSGKTACIPVKNAPFQESRGDVRNIPFQGDWGEALNGYTIIDERFGMLGQVKDVDDRTLNILLTVDYQGKDILIPLASATSIQSQQQTITLSLPDGFLEL